MRLRRFVPVLLTFLAMGVSGLEAASLEEVETRMRKDINFLASDECEGRGVSTKGINLAADFVAKNFAQAGLKPGGLDGSYFQPFTMTGSAKLESPNSLVLRGPGDKEIHLKLNDEFRPVGLSAAGKVTAPVVFVGYGITADDPAYDDFKGMDVAGKVVVILRKTPRAADAKNPFGGGRDSLHAPLATKLVNADKHKAAAVLFVNDQDTAKEKDELMPFGYTATAAAPTDLPVVHMRRATLDGLLQSALDTSLHDLEDKIDKNLKPRSAELKGWTVALEVNVQRPKFPVKNVVGVLEGKGPLAKETVIVGAHYDHLGYGGAFSLAKDPSKKAIHHGADDNGSGTTALLELARRFGARTDREGRRLVFIAFTGEESGLLGSEHYCKKPLYPLADTVAMVNMDMVGRLRPERAAFSTFLAMAAPVEPGVPAVPLSVSVLTQLKQVLPVKDKLIVYGTGTSKSFDGLIESLTKDRGFKLSKVPGGIGPSDHASFYTKKIPVFFFFTDEHADYHKPSDTADKINVPGMRRVVELVEEVVKHLEGVPERPGYILVKSAGGQRGPEGSTFPRLRFRPDYGQDDKEGVLVNSVEDGGPAAKAGIKEGDRIVELGGKPVKNFETYMVLIRTFKKGDVIELSYLRNGKKTTVKVNPDW